MPDRKMIYTIFTVENNISLEKESIDFLSLNIKPNDLNLLVKSYKSRFGTSLIPFEQFKIFVMSNKKIDKFFIIENVSSINGLMINKYNFLKSKSKMTTTLINKINNKENFYLFGMFYTCNDKFILEDESGTVILQLPKDKDYFLVDKLFINVYGYKDTYSFKVLDTLYLSIDLPANRCKQIAKKHVCILFFNGQIDKTILKPILVGYEDKPEIVFITGPFTDFNWYVEDLSRLFKDIQFVFLPDRNDFYQYKLPKYILPTKKIEFEENVHFATNPCEIKLNNRRILILKDDYFYNLKNVGIFGKENRKANMLEAIVSQYSYHVSDMTEHGYEMQPDLILCAEKHMNINEDVNGVKVITIGNFDYEGEFAMYDSADNSVELCQYKK